MKIDFSQFFTIFPITSSQIYPVCNGSPWNSISMKNIAIPNWGSSETIKKKKRFKVCKWRSIKFCLHFEVIVFLSLKFLTEMNGDKIITLKIKMLKSFKWYMNLLFYNSSKDYNVIWPKIENTTANILSDYKNTSILCFHKKYYYMYKPNHTN